MTRTYNPILERTEVTRRWFGSSVSAPELGTAFVLVRNTAEPIVVWHGKPAQTGRLGEYRRYVVDVAKHYLSFDMKTASAQQVFPFAVTVELACQVLNPLTIVRDNIQDMTAALMPSLTREIRDTAARFDVLRPTEAAAAIEARLSSADRSPDVELGGYSVTVKPVDTQGVVAAKQQLGVQALWFEQMKKVAEGGQDDQLAQLLAMNNGDVREVLAYLANERDADANIKLKALQIAMGGNMEDMDIADVNRNALGTLFGGNGNDSGGKQASMRERLERRNQAALEKGRVVEGDAPASATAKKGGPESAAKPAGQADPGKSEQDSNGAAPANGA